MKITRISAQNYLGIRAADIVLDRPVQLFAGRNGAGKSSLMEGVRHALTGETVRVGLKKDYGSLLTEGAEIDTALVFGTLKALPGGLPDSMQAHWIDGGVVGQMREAA